MMTQTETNEELWKQFIKRVNPDGTKTWQYVRMTRGKVKFSLDGVMFDLDMGDVNEAFTNSSKYGVKEYSDHVALYIKLAYISALSSREWDEVAK
jgi:hypothetical protein